MGDIREAIRRVVAHFDTQLLGLMLEELYNNGYIVLAKEIKDKETKEDIPGVTNGINIFMNEQLLGFFDNTMLGFILLHELEHMLLGHNIIWEFKYPRVGNLCTDLVVNRLLLYDYKYPLTEEQKYTFVLPETMLYFIVSYAIAPSLKKTEKCIEMAKNLIEKKLVPLGVEFWEKAGVGEAYGVILSVMNPLAKEGCLEIKKCQSSIMKRIPMDENLAEKICDKCGRAKEKIEKSRKYKLGNFNGNDIIPSSNIDKKDGEIEVNPNTEPNEKAYKETKKWVNKIRNEYRKLAGTGKGVLRDIELRLAEEYKVPWEELLENIVSGRANEFLSTWRRLNRRMPYVYPGYVRLSPPRVVLILDVSGSIGDEEYNHFISEINRIIDINNGNIYAILFSSGIEKIVEGENISINDIEDAIRNAYHGGTEIKEALKHATEIVRPDDVVVVFTDGFIFDQNDPEVINYADEILSTVYASVDIYTGIIAKCFRDWINLNYYHGEKV